jgi:predicted ATPase
MKSEFALNIKDRYINSNLQYFDQRSTNEGFLYLLFYSTLFISKLTPAFFAIDNIDTSFNPKLCMELTKNLASLAQEHNKQVIVTTHNPAILDGLDLKDDNQRLFVVRRNDDGHTIARRIEYKPERTMKLSEVWTNGYIGGLPENF